MHKREVFTLLVLIAYLCVAGFLVPSFFNPANIISILYSTAIVLPCVLGVQALLITGKFDLSVGSVAAVTGVVTGIVLSNSGNVALALAVGILTAVGFGLLNGALVTKLRLNSLIATLATMGIARAIALGVPQGRVVSGFPESYGVLAQSKLLSFPTLIIAAALLTLIAMYSFTNIRTLRRFYAAGSNSDAANCAGIRSDNLVWLAFLLCALGAGLTGILQSSRTMSASPLVFQQLPLEAIAACVIGGASLKGGEGSVLGALLGVLVVVATRNITVLLEIQVYWKEMVIGIILILAVVFDHFVRRKIYGEST